MQVLPVSSVANFQLWAVGARGQKRQECRFPEVRRVGVRGRGRPRFFVGVGGRGRTWDVRRRTLVAFGELVRQDKVLRPTSYVLSTAAKMAAPHTLGRGAPSNRCGRLGLAPPQAARARAPLPHRAAKLAVASARRPYHAAATEHGPPGAVATSCDPPAGGLILRSARFPPRQRRISARVAFQRDVQNGTDCRCVVGGCWRLDKWGCDLVFSTPNPYRDCFCDQ